MRLIWEPASNLLRLTLTEDAAPATTLMRPGTLDVAANGRLVGVELRGAELPRLLRRWAVDPIAAEFTHLADDDSAYIDLSVGPPDDDIRSSEVTIAAELDDDAACVALAIPRRGAGYEIAFPSGNR
jgi:hypothetical protein